MLLSVSIESSGRENVNRKIRNNKNMNTPVVGIDIGEEKSTATYLSPDGDMKENFEFDMNTNGYKEFASRIPRETRIAFEASGSAYVVDRTLRELGYEDITVAHPKELRLCEKLVLCKKDFTSMI